MRGCNRKRVGVFVKLRNLQSGVGVNSRSSSSFPNWRSFILRDLGLSVRRGEQRRLYVSSVGARSVLAH